MKNRKFNLDDLTSTYEDYINNYKDEYVDIDYFIKNHKHKNYCKIVMDEEGSVCYVKPNHVRTLIRRTGKSEEEIYKEIPVTANVIRWLTDHTKCVCIDTTGFLIPEKLTLKQIESLKKLFSAELVGKTVFNYNSYGRLEYLFENATTDEERDFYIELINENFKSN